MEGNPLSVMNIGIELYSIVICFILVIYHWCHLSDCNSQKHWFIAMLLSNIAMMLGDLTDWMFNGAEGQLASVVAPLGMCLFYGTPGVLLWCFMGYLKELLGVRTRVIAGLWRLTAVLGFFQVLFFLMSLKNGMYFYYTADNDYVRGSFYILSQIIPCLMYATNGILIYIGRHQLHRMELLFLLGYIVLPLAGQVLQMMFYGVAYINIMTTIALLLININVQNEKELAAKRLEKELAELRIDIMLSQIRPHFLYNALTAIRQLCDTDTEQAKESILDFSRFLRANMNSLTTKEPIAFERELEHVQSYLNLEQQRFGKRLKVIYDINSREFQIPTLILQRIVENAVRHGIKKRPGGGTVKIYTEEWKDGNMIIVSDNGVGFEEEKAGFLAEEGKEDPGHIGIANVRRRLRAQCNGTLMINSSGEGTKVTIWIPKVWRSRGR